MFIYNIITTADTGSLEVLTYFSNDKIEYGQVVKVQVRNKEVLAINISQSDELSQQSRGDSVAFEVKEILEILPLVLPKQSLDLILKTHAFSWNKISSIVSAVLQPFSVLEKKLNEIAKLNFNGLIDLNKLNDSQDSKVLNKKTVFEVYHEPDLVFRIMYLIRSELEKSLSNKNKFTGQILILFPDVATLESLSKSIELALANLSQEFSQDIVLDKYTSSGSIVSNRRTVLNLFKQNLLQIVLTTRSGIFLPFVKLTKTFLIEESNNNLIQEQNSLYFDARDISYILSQIWACDLIWVSHFPSSRSLAYRNDEKQAEIRDVVAAINDRHDFDVGQSVFRSGFKIHEKNSLVDDNHLFSSATENDISSTDKPILFIHPRRGNFRITQCQSCRHVWYCPNCTAALITYKSNTLNQSKLDLVCHHCQTKIDYPNQCPECQASQIASYSSGIDDLAEFLDKTYPEKEVFKIDTSSAKLFEIYQKNILNAKEASQSPIYLTSKIFDPRIDYSNFEKIVFIQAQNLASGIDYLTTEEVFLSIYNVYLSVIKNKTNSPTDLIFDTTTPELEIFQKFLTLNLLEPSFLAIISHFKDLMTSELLVRNKFHLPPFYNLLLLSQSGKDYTKLKANIVILYNWVKENTKDFGSELEIIAPYPAKMLKRQGLFTFHLLLKYPKNFKRLKDLEKILKPKIADMHLQARLNPRHVF